MARSSPATKMGSPYSTGCATGRDEKATRCCRVFDLLELDGADLRQKPIEERKRLLTHLLRNAGPGMQLNLHLDEPGDVMRRPWRARPKKNRESCDDDDRAQ